MSNLQVAGELERLRELTRRATAALERMPSEADALATEAVPLAESVGDDAALASLLHVAGEARLARAQYPGAETALKRGLDVAQRLGDQPLMVKILRALLKCNFFTQDPDAALLRGMQALQLTRDLEDRVSEARTHNDLGLVYGRLGDLEGALEHLLSGLRLLQDEKSAKLGSLLNNIGNVYFELDDYRESLSFYQRAVEALREEGARRAEGIAHGNVGRAMAGLGKYGDAHAAFQRCLETHQENEDHAYIPPALARLASALGHLGRDDEARQTFARAFASLEGSSHREFEDEVLAAAGRFHLTHGELDEAIARMQKALDLIPSDETTRRAYELHEAMAEAFEMKGDLECALLHFKTYHRIRQAVSSSSTTVRIRGLMLQFDVERARQQEEIFRLRNVELAAANEELQALHRKLEAKNRELHQISIEDPLTQLFNRRYLDVQLGVEVSRAQRHQRPLCVAMCDIDHFKEVNDHHSHALGDEVLRLVAGLLRNSARGSDVIARFGGEEFLLILPDTDVSGAEALTERIRSAVAGYDWNQVEPGLRITLSIGVAELQDDMEPAGLLGTADARLYEAKRGGRDRVVA